MSQLKRNMGFKILAVVLAILVQGAWLPAMAAPVGSISGVIKTDDGREPLVGAVVHIAERESGKVFSSQPSAADGSFTIGDLPYGKYEIGVESAGGLFLVYVPVTIRDGATQDVELVVTGSAEARELVGAGRKAGSAGVWGNPLTASLIVVGGAIVVGALISASDDDDEGMATPAGAN